MARGNISQQGRFLEVLTLLDDGWFLTDFIGEESLSDVFCFHLTLVSNKADIDVGSFIGKSLTFRVNDQINSRMFSGVVQDCVPGEIISDDLRECKIVLVPWFWHLKFDSDCRIFQDKTIVQIFTSICKEKGFADYDISQLSGSYKPLPYCVQYNESTFDFLRRILAKAGIYYYFTYQQDKQVLVLADKTPFAEQITASINYSNASVNELSVHEWVSNAKLHSNQSIINDYNYLTPTDDLTSAAKTALTDCKLGGSDKFNVYNYPGKFQDSASGVKLAKGLQASDDSRSSIRRGRGNILDFSVGKSFKLAKHDDKKQNGKYQLIAVCHEAFDHTHVPVVNDATHNGLQQKYVNVFRCIDAKLQFQTKGRPPEIGKQTAIVVGLELGKLLTDKYGRIKVRFYWDHNSPTNSDATSCWIRVAQQVASSHWGMQFMPRVGNEVIVDFENGNPDRPIIVGSVHNANNLPPYDYPNEQQKSGVKTRSVASTDTDKSNELQFNDAKTKEEFNLHASKDYLSIVGKSTVETVAQNKELVITGARDVDTEQKHVVVVEKQLEVKAGKGHLIVSSGSIIVASSKISMGE